MKGNLRFGKFSGTAFVIKTEKDREAVLKRLDDFKVETLIRYSWLMDKALPFKLFLCDGWGCQYSSDIYFHHKDYKDINLKDFLRKKGDLFEIE